jgi:DNA-binding transcriptional ArsR family regulator
MVEIIQKSEKEIKSGIEDDSGINNLAQFFSILADATRLRIVLALQTGELCVHEIAKIVNISLSAVSHQLRLLRTMRLVKFRQQGKEVYYALDDDHIERLILIAKEHLQE